MSRVLFNAGSHSSFIMIIMFGDQGVPELINITSEFSMYITMFLIYWVGLKDNAVLYTTNFSK